MALSLRKRREKSLISKLHKELQARGHIPVEDTVDRCISAATAGMEECVDVLAAYCRHIEDKTGWIMPLLLPFKQTIKMPSFSSILTLSPTSRKIQHLELEDLLDECISIYSHSKSQILVDNIPHFVVFQIDNIDESLVYCNVPDLSELRGVNSISSKIQFLVKDEKTRLIFSFSSLLDSFPFAKKSFTSQSV